MPEGRPRDGNRRLRRRGRTGTRSVGSRSSRKARRRSGSISARRRRAADRPRAVVVGQGARDRGPRVRAAGGRRGGGGEGGGGGGEKSRDDGDSIRAGRATPGADDGDERFLEDPEVDFKDSRRVDGVRGGRWRRANRKPVRRLLLPRRRRSTGSAARAREAPRVPEIAPRRAAWSPRALDAFRGPTVLMEAEAARTRAAAALSAAAAAAARRSRSGPSRERPSHFGGDGDHRRRRRLGGRRRCALAEGLGAARANDRGRRRRGRVLGPRAQGALPATGTREGARLPEMFVDELNNARADRRRSTRP